MLDQISNLISEKATSEQTVSIEDLDEILREMGQSFSKSDFRRQNPGMDFNLLGFDQIATVLTSEQVSQDEMFKIFRVLDKDGKLAKVTSNFS